MVLNRISCMIPEGYVCLRAESQAYMTLHMWDQTICLQLADPPSHFGQGTVLALRSHHAEQERK